MNPQIKARWVAALRSGDYTQVEGRLNKNDEGFCCLGVLCEIAVEDGIVNKKLASELGYEHDSFAYLDDGINDRTYPQFDVLPHNVKDWAGIRDTNPEVKWEHKGEEDEYPLSALNDDFKLTFTEIADIIEEQL
jgi:hypothetical protein